MKDSKDYSPRVMKLFRSLKREHGAVENPTYTDPVDAVVDALVSEGTTLAAAGRTIKRMRSHFVDLNDLRVSRKEEILDIFGDHSEAAEHSAGALTRVLNALFEKQNKVTLEPLRHEGKRQAKKELEEIDGITPFAVNYCFLTALDGHAIPLNAAMLAYLRDNELVHPDASDHDIAGFLERQIAAADAFTFYTLLREAAEQDKTGGRPKPAPKAAAAKKKTTARKKTAARKTAKKKTTKKKQVKKK